MLRPVDTCVLIARTTDGESMIPWLRGWLLGQGFAASGMGHPKVSPSCCFAANRQRRHHMKGREHEDGENPGFAIKQGLSN